MRPIAPTTILLAGFTSGMATAGPRVQGVVAEWKAVNELTPDFQSKLVNLYGRFTSASMSSEAEPLLTREPVPINQVLKVFNDYIPLLWANEGFQFAVTTAREQDPSTFLNEWPKELARLPPQNDLEDALTHNLKVLTAVHSTAPTVKLKVIVPPDSEDVLQ